MQIHAAKRVYLDVKYFDQISMKTCFVIMPIGTQNVTGYLVSQEELRDRYTFLIKEALLKAEPSLEIVRADEVGIPGGVSSDILTRIMKSDIVIADITYPNPNVFYELGLRHASKIGTILIKEKNDSNPPFDVYDLRHIIYENTPLGLHTLAEEIKKSINWIKRNSNEPDNRFLELSKYFNHQYPSFNSKNFPKTIQHAIDEQLYSRYFYKENVTFNVTVKEVLQNEIVFDSILSYDVTNRTDETHNWKMQKKSKYRESEIIEVRFNDKKIDTNGLDFQNGRGIIAPQLMKPGEKAKAYFRTLEKFRKKDYALYTSYHPATDLRLIVNNPFTEIFFDFEVFYFSPVYPVKMNDITTEIFFGEGILPHQGVRLNWEN